MHKENKSTIHLTNRIKLNLDDSFYDAFAILLLPPHDSSLGSRDAWYEQATMFESLNGMDCDIILSLYNSRDGIYILAKRAGVTSLVSLLKSTYPNLDNIKELRRTDAKFEHSLLNLLLLSLGRRPGSGCYSTSTSLLLLPLISDSPEDIGKVVTRISIDQSCCLQIEAVTFRRVDALTRVDFKYLLKKKAKAYSFEYNYNDSSFFSYDIDAVPLSELTKDKIQGKEEREERQKKYFVSGAFNSIENEERKGEPDEEKNNDYSRLSKAASLPFADFTYKPNGSIKRSESYEDCRNHLYFEVGEGMQEVMREGMQDVAETRTILRFERLEEIGGQSIGTAKAYTKEAFQQLDAFYKDKLINVTTYEDELIPELEKIREVLSRKYCEEETEEPWLQVKTSFKEIDPKALNIVVIHSKQYYKENGLHDVYLDTVRDDVVIQHVVVDSITLTQAKKRKKQLTDEELQKLKEWRLKKETSLKKNVLRKCLVETLVKYEIQHNTMSLYAAGNFNRFPDDVKILDFIEPGEDEEYFHLRIFLGENPDEDAKTEYHHYDNFGEMPEELQIQLMNVDVEYSGAIVEDEKTSYVIQRTNVVALIDEGPLLKHIEFIESEEGKNMKNVSIRAKANQYLINNALNIHGYYRDDVYPNMFQVCTGININGGMQQKIPNAIHMYNVYRYDANGPLDEEVKDFQKYLDLYNINVISTSDRFTVLPFPFKYLHEYICMLDSKKRAGSK